MALSPGGLLDTALELRFALQYPHYLKQWEAGNRLQIMLQRRKRYKNRTILGYKTLCSGTINMAAAVQRQMDMDLELYGEAASGAKENVPPLARVQVHSLSSQPVDHEETADRLKTLADGAGSAFCSPQVPLSVLFPLLFYNVFPWRAIAVSLARPTDRNSIPVEFFSPSISSLE